MQTELYLASSSPRRRELLALLNIHFESLVPDIIEERTRDESPQTYVKRLACQKAQAGVAIAMLPLPVLGADTIVVLDGEVLEKPVDEQDAKRILSLLSGRTHQVFTAIAVANEQHVMVDCVVTDVTFCELSERAIDDYILTKEPMDKAGAYGIQGIGGAFVRRINGSYHNVVGLPLVETRELITKFTAEK